jgi:hypothetical protein
VIAYTSDESGVFEVYLRPYPNTDDGQRKISTKGGRQSLWSRTGRELYYRDFGGAMIAVPVAAGKAPFTWRTRNHPSREPRISRRRSRFVRPKL